MLAVLAAAALAVCAAPSAHFTDQDAGPALAGDLPNLREVEPGLYRLAQPTAEGVRRLARDYRVRTILSLRLAVPREEAEAAARERVELRLVRMNGVLMPTFRQVDEAVAVLDTAPRPAAVHCLHGRDRTGVVVAAYEVAVRRRDVGEAAREARLVGCCPATFGGPLEKWLGLYLRHYDGDPTVQEPRPEP